MPPFESEARIVRIEERREKGAAGRDLCSVEIYVDPIRGGSLGPNMLAAWRT